MEPPKRRQGWTITVRAKSKGLDLRLAASNILPQWGSGGERASFLLRLRHRFLLRVESENKPPSSSRDKAKPFQLLKEAFRRRGWFSPKNAASKSGSKCSKTGSLLGFSNQHGRQGLVAVMIGSLFLLCHSAYEKYLRGVAIHALASFLNLIVLFSTGRINLLLLRVAGMFASLGFSFSYLTYAGYLPIIAWRLWSYIFTFGYLIVFSQILPSCISRFITRR